MHMHLLLLLFLSYVSLNVHSKQIFFVGLEQHEGEWFSFLNVTLDNFYSCVKYITYLQYCVKKKKKIEIWPCGYHNQSLEEYWLMLISGL